MLYLVIIFFILGYFFSGSETAIITANKIKIRHIARRKKYALTTKGAKSALRYLMAPDHFLVLVLVGTNVANISTTTFAAIYLSRYVPPERIEIINILIITPLLLIGAEIIPKNLFFNHSNFLTPYVALPLRMFEWVLYPVVYLTKKMVGPFIEKIRNQRIEEPFVTRQDFLDLVQKTDTQKGLNDMGKNLIRKTLEIEHIRVSQFLTPGRKLPVISAGSTVAEASHLLRKNNCTYLPVLKNDKVIGMIQSTDLLLENPTLLVDDFVKTPYYISESMHTLTLLRVMKKHGVHRAFVLDSNNKFVGTVDLDNLADMVFTKPN